MFSQIKTVQDAANYQLCCGCGVCAYLFPEQIKMTDIEAFGRRPQCIEVESLVDCFTDIKIFCPGVSITYPHTNSPNSIRFPSNDWGTVLDFFEGYASDPEIRYKGSSGGAISALALYCLEQENMQGVLHIKADEQIPYLNKTTMSRSKEDILAATGSRYSPASPCEQLKEIEEASGLSVFIGKPCDISAVEKARKLKSKLDKNIGLTIACFCAGTPSTQGTLEMLRQMGVVDREKLKELRYRGCGWPGMTTAVQEIDHEPIISKISYKQSWEEILQKYRPWRCYICPDHTGEFADIAVGDPWYREIEEGEKGYSLILARTQKGRVILQKAVNAGYLIAKKADQNILPNSQPNLLKVRAALWGRLFTLKILMAPCPEYANISLFPLWMTELNAKEKAQSIYGTIKRVFKKKLRKKCRLN